MATRPVTYRLATVFGGSGFIGRHVVQRLAAQGWRVRVATRDPEGAAFLRPRGDVGQVEPIYADLHKEFSIQAAVERADLVINLAGIPYERGKQRFQSVHVDGAARIAAAAKAAGVERLIHISSLSADESSDSTYARSKAEGEKAVLAAFSSAVILRPGAVFGPEDRFFNLFAELAGTLPILPVVVADGFRRKGFCLDLWGSGGAKFQPVYVGDVGDAVMAAIAPGHEGKTYELVGPRTYSLKEIVEMALRASGRKRLLVPMPLGIAKLKAIFLQFLPKPPLTPDQVRRLARDIVATGSRPGLKELGIVAQDAEGIVPSYLARFKSPYLFDKKA